jgi:hypothetical protein
MDSKFSSIGNILSGRFDKLKPPDNKKTRPINVNWEEAKEFGTYVGLSPAFILRLIKKFGKPAVFGLRSWLKDVNFDDRGKQGLIYWKLKQYAQIQEAKKTIPQETKTPVGQAIQPVYSSQGQKVP